MLAMDTATGDIRAVEFTSSHEGDSRLLPDLLDQFPDGEDIESVTTDGACDARRCLDAILARSAEPIIPTHWNGRMWKPDCPAAIWRNGAASNTAPRACAVEEGVWPSCPKSYRGPDDLAGSLEPVAFICSTSSCLAIGSSHEIPIDRSPKSTSASFAVSLGPMAFDRSVMNRCPGPGPAEIERVK